MITSHKGQIMSFYPPESGGGSNGPLPPASIPDLYNPNKTARFFWECFGSGTGMPSPLGSTTTNATWAQVADGSRVGVVEATSSTTANGFAWLGAGTQGVPLLAAPIMTFYFKTPTVIDAASIIKIGLTVNVAGNNDVTGIDIQGATAKITNIINGVANQTSGSITLVANTWYTARINFTSATSVTCTLYSAAGASLLTNTMTAPFAITATVPATFNGLKASNSGVVSVPMVRIDAYELVVNTSVSDRVYIDV
ncbi:gp34 virion protein [Iodobacter phage PhiPLPE]|uniref:Gp34 virion protein n=1 Tax=Iodobacter phage PhiPLPE TaxID=551895 RepID=B5AX53_9CAUD|nr:gp34 virion protein [Iodobacter phage PhiPLPE]ACG60356.1 gp34 virion protein [Iodobacter phage PhiPLPE]